MKILFSLIIIPFIMAQDSVFDFTMKAIDGQEVSLSQYKGKSLLLVNVASKCGFTPQYEDLEKFYRQFGDKVVVLGFPANNFGSQEPGTNEEIAAFCEKNFGVTFPMFEKISVVGEDQHPLYQWLKAKTGKEPTWNFCKYLITADGGIFFFPSKTNPLDQEIVDKL